MYRKPHIETVLVTFDFNGSYGPNPSVLNVIVNGNAHQVPWPYPDNNVEEWRTYAVVVPITDLVHGTNVVQLGADQAEVFANVDIILGDVPGAVPILPGSNNKYPGT